LEYTLRQPTDNHHHWIIKLPLGLRNSVHPPTSLFTTQQWAGKIGRVGKQTFVSKQLLSPPSERIPWPTQLYYFWLGGIRVRISVGGETVLINVFCCFRPTFQGKTRIVSIRGRSLPVRYSKITFCSMLDSLICTTEATQLNKTSANRA
jgi:hypothetical protein